MYNKQYTNKQFTEIRLVQTKHIYVSEYMFSLNCK